jgi:hypothetical protein
MSTSRRQPARTRVCAPYAGTILSAFLLFRCFDHREADPAGSAVIGGLDDGAIFFQSVLAGYAHADLTTRLGVRRQTLLHIALLLSLASLPILASAAEAAW